MSNRRVRVSAYWIRRGKWYFRTVDNLNNEVDRGGPFDSRSEAKGEGCRRARTHHLRPVTFSEMYYDAVPRKVLGRDDADVRP